MSTKGIIFDLDDTLIDTSRLFIPIKDRPEFFTEIEKPIPLFPGALENLTYLSARYLLFLVTSGDQKVQQKKLISCGVRPFFREVYFPDPEKLESKKKCFEEISQRYGLRPETLISIGNRVSTDLIPAAELGIKTCLFNYGEHRKENENSKFFRPDWTIDRHEDFVWSCVLPEGSP